MFICKLSPLVRTSHSFHVFSISHSIHTDFLYIYTYMCIYIYICIYIFISTYTHTHTYMHIYKHTHTGRFYIYICIYTYTHTHTYMHIYKHTHTGRFSYNPVKRCVGHSQTTTKTYTRTKETYERALLVCKRDLWMRTICVWHSQTRTRTYTRTRVPQGRGGGHGMTRTYVYENVQNVRFVRTYRG